MIVTDQPWRAEAACRGVDPNVFHPHTADDRRPRTASGIPLSPAEAAAVAICRRCPVIAECAVHHLWEQPHAVTYDAIVGGMTGRDRKRIKRETIRRRKAIAS